MDSFLLIVIIGFVGAYIGSLTYGITSIITISLLIWSGIPPLSAFALFAVGVWGYDIGGLTPFLRTKQIVWNLIPPLILTSLIGFSVGSALLVRMDDALIRLCAGTTLLFLAMLLSWHSSRGITRTIPSPRRRLLGHALSLMTSIYGGSFAFGYGLLNMTKNIYCYGITLLSSKATSKIPDMIGGLGSISVFALHDAIRWDYALTLFVGMMLGGFVGTTGAIRLGDQKLKHLAILTMICCGVGLLWQN